MLYSSPGTQSLQRRFGHMSFRSPMVNRPDGNRGRGTLGLTPVMEEFSQLHVTSEPRLERRRVEGTEEGFPTGEAREGGRRYSFEVPQFNLNVQEELVESAEE